MKCPLERHRPQRRADGCQREAHPHHCASDSALANHAAPDGAWFTACAWLARHGNSLTPIAHGEQDRYATLGQGSSIQRPARERTDTRRGARRRAAGGDQRLGALCLSGLTPTHEVREAHARGAVPGGAADVDGCRLGPQPRHEAGLGPAREDGATCTPAAQCRDGAFDGEAWHEATWNDWACRVMRRRR